MFNNIFPKNLNTLKNIITSLHSRNYRLYFIGQGISLIGTWMQNIALSWLIYRLTGSVFLLGLIGFTSLIPTFVLSPFTGVLTDSFDKHKIMIITQIFFMLLALIMTILVLFEKIEVWHIITLSLLSGIVTAFDAPARQSLVSELIDNPEEIGNAVALNSAIFNGARLIGPAIAGITIAAVGEGICFLINTLSFVAVIIALLKMKISVKRSHLKHSNFSNNLREGFNYTFQSVPIRTLIFLLAILSLVGLPFVVLLPAYAKEILNGGSDTLGYLMSSLGAGSLLGAIYMAARISPIGLCRIISNNTLFLGIALILSSLTDILNLTLIIFFIGGISMILTLSAINTMLQIISEDAKRGRVMSFYAMALMGTSPIGNLLAGSIASGIGIPKTLFICGIITLFSGIWFEFNRKSLQKYVNPIYIEKGILQVF